jgi:hypothetical protein
LNWRALPAALGASAKFTLYLHDLFMARQGRAALRSFAKFPLYLHDVY